MRNEIHTAEPATAPAWPKQRKDPGADHGTHAQEHGAAESHLLRC